MPLIDHLDASWTTSFNHMNRKTLPTEILCEIFLLLCEKPIALHVLENKTCPDGFPWAVGRVCKQWRGAFISYPRLWTNLSLQYIYDHTLVNADSPIYPDLDKFAETDWRTKLYLERSRRLPLTISISITASSNVRRVAHFPRDAWKTLLSCSDRWKKAELVIGNAPDIVGDLLECRNRVRALESVGLTVSGLVHRSRAHGSAFVAAPRLTELKLKHHGANSMWVFPWSQLTKLDLEVSRANICPRVNLEAILSQMQNLEELHFFPTCRFTEYNPSAPIRLPNVRFLELSSVPFAFKWFETPLLEHLWVHSTRSGWNNDSAIPSLIRRSSCIIRHLTLQRCVYQPGCVIMEALGNNVEYLCIKGTHRFTSRHITWHIANFEDGIHFPNLQELQVVYCYGEADDEFMGTLPLLVEARGKGSSSRTVVLLERVILELRWGTNCNCYGKRCRKVTDKTFGIKLDKILGMIRPCPSVTDISVDRTHSQICTITLRLTD